MNRKEKSIEYVDGHYLKDNELVPMFKSVDIMMSGTKRFHNCLYLILGLTKLQRLLMDWVSEEMDERNIIRNDKYTRSVFIKFISELLIDGENKTYRDESVNNAFHGLYTSGLLLPVTKGVYQVNPEYYWKGSDVSRIQEIMLNIRFSSKSANFKVLTDGEKYNLVKKK